VRTRTFVIAGIFAALLVAGVGSYWASTHPDGLTHVAEQAGFSDTAKDSAAKDSPLSGYQVKGVDNPAVSRGLAGVIGALTVLALAGGLAYVVRRRGSSDEEAAGHAAPATGAPSARRTTPDGD
jgi:cobalt/nickel transport protein